MDQGGPVDFEVVGVRICRMDGGMVDNIMMASAGQGGAGLRGDQYYPPPPPPPRFPPPFPSPRGIPTRSLPRSSSFLLPSTTIAVSTLQPSTFSPFYRRPSFASSSFSTSPVLRIELLGRRDAPRLRSIPSYVCLCVCVCVCVCESAHGVCICGLEREGLFIVIRGTSDSLIANYALCCFS